MAQIDLPYGGAPTSGTQAILYANSSDKLLHMIDDSAVDLPLVRGSMLGEVIAAHLAIPSLRGFWPMSAELNSNDAFWSIPSLVGNRPIRDAASYARGMTAGLVPYVTMAVASSQYFYRADELGLRGSSAFGGWTWGGWYNFTSLPTAGNVMALMSKWTSPAANEEYLIQLSNSGGTTYFQAYVGSGSAATAITHPTAIASINTWYYIVARWAASSTLDLFVSAVKGSTACAYATLAGGTAQFQIGAAFGANEFIDGSATLCFVAGYPLSDAHIQGLYNISKTLFP